MFTGIVEEVGTVLEIPGTRLVIQAGIVLEDMRLGGSIAVNGACLTVVELSGPAFAVDVVPETRRRTNLGDLYVGAPVNLERALALNDRLGGHIVQGHVEATGRVESVTPEQNGSIMGFEAPPEVMRYVVAKGFVAVDGISLTVVECDTSSFSVSVIPYTRERTVLGAREVGDRVNLETDIVARYVERLLPAGRG